MSIIIRENPLSRNVLHSLQNATLGREKSSDKLASGSRIVRAADDAAGLAVSESFKADLKALDQASRNSSDGINLLQTMDGYLEELTNILGRMRELAEESMTGTLTDSDRSNLTAEYNEHRKQILTIAWGSSYSGIPLLDGTAGVIDIQVGIGTESKDKVSIDLTHEVDIVAMPLTADLSTTGSAGTAMSQVQEALDHVLDIRSEHGATLNRLETVIGHLQTVTENLTAANSRIRDVDVAAETSRLTSATVLQNAGVSLMAQAKSQNNLGLSIMGEMTR